MSDNSDQKPAQARRAKIPQQVNDGAGLLRPYIITGGRTEASQANADLSIESVIQTKEGIAELGFEKRAIAEHCKDPKSIGEIAAHLKVPLGVAVVLVSDMLSAGLVIAHKRAEAGDTRLIERLIEGIRAI